jgi:hypothetical protein
MALIPDCFCPIAPGDGGDPIGHGHEGVPGLAAGLDDGRVVGPDAQAELVLAQVLPDILDRVHRAPSRSLIAMGTQLGAVRRQRQEGEVVGNGQVRRAMPAGTVEDEDGVGIWCDVAADLGEVQAHGLGVGARQDEPGPDRPLGADGTEQVGPRIAAVAWRSGPRAAPPQTGLRPAGDPE